MKTAITLLFNCVKTTATLELVATALEATACALEHVADALTKKEKENDRE